MQLHARPQFYRDIEQEVQWLAERAGAETAEHWAAALDRTIDLLHRQPLMGRQRTDLKPAGIRSWRMTHFRRWLVFYQVEGETLTLLRVRYGHMDLSARNY